MGQGHVVEEVFRRLVRTTSAPGIDSGQALRKNVTGVVTALYHQ